MSVKIVNGSVIVDDCTLTIEELHRAIVDLNSKIIHRSNKKYTIDGNLVLQNSATLVCTDVDIICLGTMVRIVSNSTLQLGVKSDAVIDGNVLTTTSQGSTLSIPYGTVECALGSENSDSGNLLAYGSTIECSGAWSFTSTQSLVEVIDCTINAYGTISGENSVVRNVVYNNLNLNRGLLVILGSIKEYSNITINNVLPIYKHNTDIVELKNKLDEVSRDIKTLLVASSDKIKQGTRIIKRGNISVSY